MTEDDSSDEEDLQTLRSSAAALVRDTVSWSLSLRTHPSMPPRSQEEKECRRLLCEEKKEAREKEKAKEVETELVVKNVQPKAGAASPNNEEQHSPLLHVPDDSLRQILCFLPSQDLGAITLLCLALDQSFEGGGRSSFSTASCCGRGR
jgi:hypothetical protein